MPVCPPRQNAGLITSILGESHQICGEFKNLAVSTPNTEPATPVRVKGELRVQPNRKMIDLAEDARSRLSRTARTQLDKDLRAAIRRCATNCGETGELVENERVMELLLDGAQLSSEELNQHLTEGLHSEILFYLLSVGTPLDKQQALLCSIQLPKNGVLHQDGDSLIDTFRRLLDQDVDINYSFPKDRRTPLHYAAFFSVPVVTELLLDYGADPERRDHRGRTPLMCATRYGSIESMRLLRRHGASTTGITRHTVERGALRSIDDASEIEDESSEMLRKYGFRPLRPRRLGKMGDPAFEKELVRMNKKLLRLLEKDRLEVLDMDRNL
jgi:hypothetical protein